MSQFSLFDENLEPSPAPTLSLAPPLPPPPAPEPDAPLTADEKAALLDHLRVPCMACTQCELSRTRTHVVFGEGNPNAPLVFVGEGPGENEDATGRPFVGRAGKLLDQVLLRNGMTRNHVYICNVVKCRAAEMQEGRLNNRSPTQEELTACRGWLEQQLGIIQPLVVVCVGAPAANTVIHKGFRMTAERGRWFSTSPFAPWATAVFHPAYVLRLHGPGYDAALETLVEDVGRARQKVIEVRRQMKEAAAAGPPPPSLFEG